MSAADAARVYSRVGRVPALDAASAPLARCGHSLTACLGENSRKLILFGGATALENSSSGGGATGIRLAGATADVHCFDIRSGAWTKLAPEGEAPSPRAAHAAAAVGSMVVVQGGIGPAGLATDDLYVLDLASTPRWHRVVVQGEGPGARYAHVLALVGQRFLLVLGGNDGYKPLADAWALDTAVKPYKWQSVQASGEGPCARMYAAAAARADGLLLLCGGRDGNNQPLADVFGLARHRDGRWEWAAAPVVAPTPRYQHAAACIGARLHVSGGALGGGKMVEEKHTVVVLDTAAGAWTSSGTSETVSTFASQRCRHAVAAVGSCLFLYGGLCGGSLLDDLLVAEDARADEEMVGDVVEPLASMADFNTSAWKAWLTDVASQAAPQSALNAAAPAAAPAGMLSPPASAAAAVAVAQSPQSPPAAAQSPPAAFASPMMDAPPDSASGPAARLRDSPPSAKENGAAFAIRVSTPLTERPKSPFSGLGKSPQGTPFATPDVRLHHRAVLVAAGDDATGALGGLVRQLSIDQFENESRRVSIGTPGDMSARRPTPVFDRTSPLAGIHKSVLAVLLRPREWRASLDRHFAFDIAMIRELCENAEACLSRDTTVLQLSAPVKIFGDLHGQFGDLMRLFSEYGSPSTAGDIAYIDYLFLGDYVDRGAHSLETICLLLALKIEYPKNVHLLRGNHEAADINALFGFRLECVERLGEEGGLWAWERFNAVFNWMPLAAVIEKRVICMHGGIGKSIESVEQLEALVRPLTMETGGMVLMDLLWSDPTENDSVTGLRPNARGPGLVTFGPDRVKEFCEANGLQMIIRAHECVMDGFERFAAGQLITLFSATNYCGTANNAGAILVLGRDLVVYPKLIHPLPPQAALDDSPVLDRDSPGSASSPGERQLSTDTWMQAINRDRPPTPPRGRVGPGGPPRGLSEF